MDVRDKVVVVTGAASGIGRGWPSDSRPRRRPWSRPPTSMTAAVVADAIGVAATVDDDDEAPAAPGYC